MSVRRVLMTGDCVGGVWTYALDLAAALGAHGVEVTLFVTGPDPTFAQAADAAAVSNLTLVHRRLPLEWHQGADAAMPDVDSLLAELAAELRPDIVHVNGFAQAAQPFVAPVVCVAHSCKSSWAVAARKGPHEMGLGFESYRRRLCRGVAAADCLVAPTAAFLAAFCAANDVAPRAARVIANGRDPALFHSAEKHPVALSAGRFWDQAKGMDTLVRAAGRLHRELRAAGLTSTSGPESPGTLAEIFGDLPVPPNMTFLGRLDHPALAAEMAAAAVFVAPARYEPFGLAILEAAFSRCALVLGDIPTLRELWDGAAVFVDPEEDVALAAAVDRLLADPAACAAAGDAAFRRAQPRTAAAMADSTLALYDALLEARVAA